MSINQECKSIAETRREQLREATGLLRRGAETLRLLHEALEEEVAQLELGFESSDRCKGLRTSMQAIECFLKNMELEDLEGVEFAEALSDGDVELVAARIGGLSWMLRDSVNGEALRTECREMFPESPGEDFVHTLTVDDVGAIYDSQVANSLDDHEWPPEVAGSVSHWRELSAEERDMFVKAANRVLSDARVGEAIGSALDCMIAAKAAEVGRTQKASSNGALKRGD